MQCHFNMLFKCSKLTTKTLGKTIHGEIIQKKISGVRIPWKNFSEGSGGRGYCPEGNYLGVIVWD